MQDNNNKDTLQYPPQAQQKVKLYSQRVPIEQFKKIDGARIKHEFSVLGSSYNPNPKETFHKHNEKDKDRYSDVLAYKHNRIKIQDVQNFYINASFMRSVLDNQIYAVFAQAPVKRVIEHFWYACYHYNIKKIVMLCALEDPLRGVQAQRYWPLLNQEVKFNSVNISVKNQKQEKVGEEFTNSTIAVVGPQGEKLIEHIHWSGWRDMQKPGEKDQQLFRNIVKDCIDLIQKKQMILLHCSAGIGRTGTLAATIEAARCAKKNGAVSVFEIVDNMRRGRVGCVQKMEQYSFVYHQLQQML